MVTKVLKKIFIVVLAACTTTPVIFSSPASAVTYGDPVSDPIKFSEVIAIKVLNPNTGEYVFICTGTLISQTEVLTAAHCVRGFTSFQIEVGAIQLGAGTIYGVRGSWFSSRYSDAKFANDVGLLLLATPVVNTSFAKLSPAKFVPTKKTSYTLVGFGEDQNSDVGPLREAVLNVQTTKASKHYRRAFNSKTTLAAGRYRKTERVYAGGCSGDSGGPLFTKIKGKRYIVGVTSYGARSCEAGLPTVFARVGYYLKEISKGRQILAQSAATPLQELTFSLTSTTRSYYKSYAVSATTDPAAVFTAICVTVNGIGASSGEVTGDGTIVGYLPTAGCMGLTGSSSSGGRLDFSTSVPMAQVVVTVRDSLGRSATKNFETEIAALPLSLTLTPVSGYSWEKRYSVTIANAPLLSPLKLCVTVDGLPATSSQVEGDILEIPYTPTAGCFSSGSSYTLTGGYLAFDKASLLGTRAIVVTLTDVLNRTQSIPFTFTGCGYPYSC